MEQATLEKAKQASTQEWPVSVPKEVEERQVEARVFDFEEHRRRCVGREAIKITAGELGYNDALTYLYRYQNEGNADYMIDFESSIAERLKNSNHFENHVMFTPVSGDFVSVKDKKSLVEATDKSLPRLRAKLAENPGYLDEYKRAKLEVNEIGLVDDWFKRAGEGEFLVFESLPLAADEDFAVTRVYQRVDNMLEACYFSLNNPDTGQFNSLRKKLGVKDSGCQSALDVLAKPYLISSPGLETTSDFVDHYVGIYDQLLSEKNQKNYSFGFETGVGDQNQNSFERVKSQKGLLSVFSRTIETLADSSGRVTPEIARICEDFEITGLQEGQFISSQKAREILKAVSLGVVCSIAKVDKKTLRDLEDPECSNEANYDTVVYGSDEATANNETYDPVCPTFEMTSTQSVGQAGVESNSIDGAYGYHNRPSNFGKPKIAVCRITNCPSRGESRYVPNKTLVGGCEICVHCHKLFGKGKSPEMLYREEGKKIEEDKRKKERALAQQIETKRIDKLHQARRRKLREQEKQEQYHKSGGKTKKAT